MTNEHETEPQPLQGLTVVISGGNGGIGFGIAEAAAHAGASVMIWGRNPTKTAAATQRLEALGADVASRLCDVKEPKSLAAGIDAAVTRFGRIDGFVANAAITGAQASILDLPLDDWRLLLDNNLTSVFMSFQLAARQMVTQDSPGALLAISSIASHFGAPKKSHYAAAKAGVDSLVRTAAVELAPYRIRCNALAPGWTQTELVTSGFAGGDDSGRFEAAILRRTPLRRWAVPEDFARAATLLLDPALSFHTGDTIRIDGGYCLV